MIRIQKPAIGVPKTGSILFIHGVCHGAWCWDQYFMEKFSEAGYDTYAIDLPRHDQPGRQKGMNRLGLKDYLAAVENAVDVINADPILIGHSMGGLIVQKYLEKHPARAAVLLAPVPPTGIWSKAISIIAANPSLLKNLLFLDLYGAFYDRARQLQYGPQLAEETINVYRDQMSDESFRVFLQLQRPVVRDRYHQTTPMLILAAENDAVVPVRPLQKAAIRYQADFAVVPDIAHNVVLDHGRERVADAVLEWLKKLEVHTGNG